MVEPDAREDDEDGEERPGGGGRARANADEERGGRREGPDDLEAEHGAVDVDAGVAAEERLAADGQQRGAHEPRRGHRGPTHVEAELTQHQLGRREEGQRRDDVEATACTRNQVRSVRGTSMAFVLPPTGAAVARRELRGGAAMYIFTRMISRRVRRTCQLVLLMAVALGAGLLGASRAEAKRGHAKAAVEKVDCKKDADCVAVVDDCCPCSEGGKQRAIPKKDQASYEKDRHKRCAGTACTEVHRSQDATCAQKAFCAAGICELGDSAAAP